jgi:hypothetical protein
MIDTLFAAPNLATSCLDTGREAWAFCSVQARHRPCLPEWNTHAWLLLSRTFQSTNDPYLIKAKDTPESFALLDSGDFSDR